MQAKDYVALSASLLALVLTFLNLYVSHFRSGRLEVHAGERLKFNYFEDGNVGVAMTVALANHGARLATVQRVALLLRHRASPDSYLFEPLFYQRLDDDGDKVNDSEPSPITVAGKSFVIKDVLFRSSYDRPSEYSLATAGTYDGMLLAWTSDVTVPTIRNSFSLELTQESIAALARYKEEKKTTMVWVSQSQWRKWAAHWLTEVEVAALRS